MFGYAIHVYDERLRLMLYSHTYTYANEHSLEMVKERYLENNPHREARDVFVTFAS